MKNTLHTNGCTRISILNPDSSFRRNFIERYSQLNEIKVLFCSSTGREFLRRYEVNCSDLVVLSLYNPGINGIDFLEELKKKDRHAKIAVTASRHQPWLEAYFKNIGVEAYCPNAVDNVIAAAGAVLNGDTYYNGWNINENQNITSLALPNFSAMDLRMIALVYKGLKNKEIGEQLSVSKRTVDTYIRRILTRLNMKKKTQLLEVAYLFGLEE